MHTMFARTHSKKQGFAGPGRSSVLLYHYVHYCVQQQAAKIDELVSLFTMNIMQWNNSHSLPHSTV